MSGDPLAAREISMPAGSMVLLIGPSGSGKSTFAARYFPRTHVLASDEMRAIVADDPADQSATEAAFELLHTALALRLARGRTSVVDATNVNAWARGRLLAVARRAGRPAVAIVLALPLEACLAHNELRTDRRPASVVRRQHRAMLASLARLDGEGYQAVHLIEAVADLDRTSVTLVG